jgi:hypothetical protein
MFDREEEALLQYYIHYIFYRKLKNALELFGGTLSKQRRPLMTKLASWTKIILLAANHCIARGVRVRASLKFDKRSAEWS